MTIPALGLLLAGAAFAAGWLARERRIPPAPAKRRPMSGEVERATTAAGRLDIPPSTLGTLLAEGKVRALPGGVSVLGVGVLL